MSFPLLISSRLFSHSFLFWSVLLTIQLADTVLIIKLQSPLHISSRLADMHSPYLQSLHSLSHLGLFPSGLIKCEAGGGCSLWTDSRLVCLLSLASCGQQWITSVWAGPWSNLNPHWCFVRHIAHLYSWRLEWLGSWVTHLPVTRHLHYTKHKLSKYTLKFKIRSLTIPNVSKTF